MPGGGGNQAIRGLGRRSCWRCQVIILTGAVQYSAVRVGPYGSAPAMCGVGRSSAAVTSNSCQHSLPATGWSYAGCTGACRVWQSKHEAPTQASACVTCPPADGSSFATGAGGGGEASQPSAPSRGRHHLARRLPPARAPAPGCLERPATRRLPGSCPGRPACRAPGAQGRALPVPTTLL